MDASSSIEQKREHYRLEIANRTPPRDAHDEFLLGVYQRLLNDIEWLLRLAGRPVAEVHEIVDDTKLIN